MSNKHRKKSAPKPKLTIEQAIHQHIRGLQALFTVPMRVTIVMRYPADPDAEVVFSDDQIDHVIATLQRRRDAVVASQAGEAAPPPTVAADQETGRMSTTTELAKIVAEMRALTDGLASSNDGVAGWRLDPIIDRLAALTTPEPDAADLLAKDSCLLVNGQPRFRTMPDGATLDDYRDQLAVGMLTPVDQMALDNILYDHLATPQSAAREPGGEDAAEYEWFDTVAGVWKPVNRLPYEWERELGIPWRGASSPSNVPAWVIKALNSAGEILDQHGYAHTDLRAAHGWLVGRSGHSYEWYDAKADAWKPINRLPYQWEQELGIRWRQAVGENQRSGSREPAMVVVERAAEGAPAIWCDPEIVDLVSALNAAGIRTVASCSGHGELHGNIALKDGRELLIASDFATARKMDAAIAANARLLSLLREASSLLDDGEASHAMISRVDLELGASP